MSETRVGQAPSYVLVTAAYNEEKYIGRVIESVVCQSIPPKRWVIVSDGSTDGTDEIVKGFARQHDFIELLRVVDPHDRNFAAQVHAINKGMARCEGIECEFVGNLDADVSFEPTYFENLLKKFQSDPKLGLGGGDIWEKVNGQFSPRPTNQPRAVAHAVQLFRRKCFDALGGYVALPYGGPDSHAEVQCRMNGWRVQSFADLPVYHHRPGGGADQWTRSAYREGLMDYSLGIHPGFECIRLARRMALRPYVGYAFVRLCGFVAGYWCVGERAVSEEFVRYLRSEERERISQWFRRTGTSRRAAA